MRLVLLPPRKANGNQIINIQLQPNCNQLSPREALLCAEQLAADHRGRRSTDVFREDALRAVMEGEGGDRGRGR